MTPKLRRSLGGSSDHSDLDEQAGNEVREPLTRFTRPFNTTGQPVVTLPAPVNGLPVGIQVVGRTNGGALSAARWLERRWQSLSA